MYFVPQVEATLFASVISWYSIVDVRVAKYTQQGFQFYFNACQFMAGFVLFEFCHCVFSFAQPNKPDAANPGWRIQFAESVFGLPKSFVRGG
jgi:hypothetical protein